VDDVGVFRVREHVDVIPRPLEEVSVAVQQCPVVAAVIGTVQPALFRLDQRVHPVGLAARNRYADSSENSRRQAVALQPLPRRPSVLRTVQPAARSAIRQSPRRAVRLPHRREHDVRIRGIKCQVDRARFIVLVKHFLPRFPAIQRAEDAALLVRPEFMPQRRHEHDVRVFRVHDQPANLPRVFQSNVRPGFPRVRGFVHAIAVRTRAADAPFARAHVDYVAPRSRSPVVCRTVASSPARRSSFSTPRSPFPQNKMSRDLPPRRSPPAPALRGTARSAATSSRYRAPCPLPLRIVPAPPARPPAAPRLLPQMRLPRAAASQAHTDRNNCAISWSSLPRNLKAPIISRGRKKGGAVPLTASRFVWVPGSIRAIR